MKFDKDSGSADYDPTIHNSCVSSLKDYGEYYQLSLCKFLSAHGREPDDPRVKTFMEYGLTRSVAKDVIFYMDSGGRGYGLTDSPPQDLDEVVERVGRFTNNLVRARSRISQLGALNPWDFFVTITIDPKKYDRYDFGAFYKVFSKFKNNYKRDSGIKFDYVFVPEQHKDGAWHLHGLIHGLPLEHLTEYRLQDYYPFTDQRLPLYILTKIKKGEKLYYWKPFSDRFGFTIVEPIRDKSKSANYITKYIGKGFAFDNRFKNARLFMPSLGLKRAETIKKGIASVPAETIPSFDCDYVTTFKFPKADYDLESILKFFSD